MTTDDYIAARVHIVRDDTKDKTPLKACFRDVISKTYLAGAPECILGRSQSRKMAHITVAGVNPVSVSSVPANVSSPGSGATLTSLVITQSGIWTLTWSLAISTAGTVNNVTLQINGTPVMTGINRSAVQTYTENSWTGYIAAGSTVTANIITGDTGVYAAAITATLDTQNGMVVLCDSEADAAEAQRWTQTGTIAGGILQIGQGIRVQHNDEIWLAAVGNSSPALVSVISEFER